MGAIKLTTLIKITRNNIFAVVADV